MSLIIMDAYVLTSHDRIQTLIARVSLLQPSIAVTPSGDCYASFVELVCPHVPEVEDLMTARIGADRA